MLTVTDSLINVCFFLSLSRKLSHLNCIFSYFLCILQTAVLAAATLLFLIALPIVNCRRRNILRIEKLDEDLGVKGYDHGKRENREKKTEEEKLFSVQDVCYMLSEALNKCRNRREVDICKATDAKGYNQSNIRNRSSMIRCSCRSSEFHTDDCPGCELSNSVLFH